MAYGDMTGIGFAPYPQKMDNYGVFYDHENLAVRPHGCPVYLKTGDYVSGEYDIRPMHMVRWTESVSVPYIWAFFNVSASQDVTFTNDNPDVVTISPVLIAGILRAFRFEGLKTGTATVRFVANDAGSPVFNTEDITIKVVGDSLFTDDQLAAIAVGAPARQKWSFRLNDPREDLVIIHDEIDHAGLRTVTDKGSRSYEAINISPTLSRRLSGTSYEITCINSGGRFSTEASDSFFTGDYASYDPCECSLIHQVYLFVNGGWEELDFMTYEGQITDLNHSVEKNSVDIKTEELSGRFFLRTEYDESHGDYNDTTLQLDTEYP